MNNDRFIELVAKKKSGVIMLSERAELDKYLECNEEDAALSTLLDDLYEVNYSVSESYNKEDVQSILNRLNEKIDLHQKPVRRIKRSTIWISITAIAAVLVISLGIYLFDFNTNKSEVHSPNIVSTKKGSKSSLVLPDGTKVWINSDTKLSYDERNWSKAREVSLEGEAYFDVFKDPKRPFTVHTHTMDVRVTGTVFNVRAYLNEKQTETTLIHGSVEVCLKKEDQKKIMLAPNDKLIVQNSYIQPKPEDEQLNDPNEEMIELLKVKPNRSDSLVRETEWIKNRLVFEKETFRDIIPVLERWYGVKINLKKNTLFNKKFSGTFENDSLEDVLESFKFSLGFKYSVEKDEVIIY